MKLQIVSIIVAGGGFLLVFELVRRRQLMERYALLWLLSATAGSASCRKAGSGKSSSSTQQHPRTWRLSSPSASVLKASFPPILKVTGMLVIPRGNET